MNTLRFSPTVWAKLTYLRDIGKTEIGGFGITHPKDPLYVMDFKLTKQECTSASIDFDDEGISDFFLDMIDVRYEPKDFGRVWIHTHPSGVNSPSGIDETTFSKVFGKPEYAIMFILTREGTTYCRMRARVSEVGDIEQLMDVEVDYTTYLWNAPDFEAWKKEYEENVKEKSWSTHTHYRGGQNYSNNQNFSWRGRHSNVGAYGGGYWNGYEDEDYETWFTRAAEEEKEQDKQVKILNNQAKDKRTKLLTKEAEEANKESIKQAEQAGSNTPKEDKKEEKLTQSPPTEGKILDDYYLLDEELVERMDAMNQTDREILLYEIEDYYDMDEHFTE